MGRTPGATNKTERELKQDAEISRLRSEVVKVKKELKELKNKK